MKEFFTSDCGARLNYSKYAEGVDPGYCVGFGGVDTDDAGSEGTQLVSAADLRQLAKKFNKLADKCDERNVNRY